MLLTLADRLEELRQTVMDMTVTQELSRELSLEIGVKKAEQLLLSVQKEKKDLYIIGNGGSAAIASHAVTDFMNEGKISAHTLHDSAIFSCMANDYGYDGAFSKIIMLTMKPADVLIAISSSGQSKNIICAVESAKQAGSTVITFSGFDNNNPLRRMGDMNFWCDSEDYGVVEIAHQFILHNLSDRFKYSER